MKWKDFYKGLMREIKDLDIEFDAMKENVTVGKADSYPDKSKSQYPGKSVSPTTTNTAVNDPEVTSVAKTKFVKPGYKETEGEPEKNPPKHSAKTVDPDEDTAKTTFAKGDQKLKVKALFPGITASGGKTIETTKTVAKK